MNNEYEEILKQLASFKARYDKYAGQLIRLKNHVPIFIESKQLFDNFSCACPKENFFISSYPAATEKFLGHVLITCGTCFGSFVPKLNIDLDDYYSRHYQHDVQPFRISTLENDFFTSFRLTDAYNSFAKRAQFLLDISNDHPKKRILDIGSGVGVLLELSKSLSKYAVEPDPHSKKILQNELCVNVLNDIPSNSSNLKFDTVYMSHVLEHYPPQRVYSVLTDIKNILNPNGQLIVAVPDGADQIMRLMNGRRDNILFEPHTINFSLKMLVDCLTRNDFKIISASAPKSVESNPLYSDFFEKGITKLQNADIVIVAKN